MDSNCYLARLTAEDVSLLQPLEEQVQLAFWGDENYQRFLEELPEYFGCKAVMLADSGKERLIGFFLARSIYENLEILKLGVIPRLPAAGNRHPIDGKCLCRGHSPRMQSLLSRSAQIEPERHSVLLQPQFQDCRNEAELLHRSGRRCVDYGKSPVM